MTSQKEFITVYKAANAVEAHVLKHLMEFEGIKVKILGESLSSGVGELPANVLQPSLEVSIKDSQRAREIISEYETKLSQGTKTQWKCSNCGEENPDSFEFCWKCKKDSSL